MGSLYTKVDPSISKYVIFSGDPWRVEVVAKMLENVEHVGFFREFNTYTGWYKGVKITITSTGIGAPSAAIAMEEMYENGMEVAVRMGTVMGLEPNTLGRFIVPIASMREERTSLTYVPLSYPAVADLELLNCMNKTIKQFGSEYSNGVNCSMDGFYSQMKESKFSKENQTDISATFERLKKLHVVGIDMESSCMLTLGRLMGVRSCILTITTVLENLVDEIKGQARIEAEELLCKVALEGIYQFDQEGSK